MEAFPTFPLFPDPRRENVFEESGEACVACKRARGWVYTGPRYGKLDEPVVCPWCIADGSAAKLGISFNDSEQYPSFPNTPQLPLEERRLVESLTPGFVTWQGNHWLACCNKACVYLGEADSADLTGRWAAAVPSMFAGDQFSAGDIAEIVLQIARGQGPCAYVFQCRACGKLRGFWDCH